MTKESNYSLKYRMEAEDKASEKIRKVEESLKQTVAQTKEIGDKSKKSTELVGALATQLGSGAVGAFAGEVAMLTDRVAQSSEMLKAGGAGALFFKAGLVAATGVIAYKVGRALGDLIAQTEKVNKEFQRTVALSDALSGKLAGRTANRLTDQLGDAKTIEEVNKAIAAVKQEMRGASDQIQNNKAKMDELNAVWIPWSGADHEEDVRRVTKAWEDSRAEHETLQDVLVKAEQKRRELLEADKEAGAQLSEETKKAIDASNDRLAKMKDELKLLQATGDERKRLELEAQGIWIVDMDEALRVSSQLDEQKKKIEDAKLAAEEAKKAAQKRVDEAKRLADIERSTLEGLKAQAIALLDSKEAAARFRLEMQGVDSDTADVLVGLQARLDEISNAKSKSTIAPDLQASEVSRGFTGANAGFAKKAELIEAERQTKLQTEQRNLLQKIEGALKNAPKIELAQVGD